MFTREDWTLFRTLDTLSQKAGVPKNKIPLRSNRIELNAMSTPQFIQWLNDKMEIWGQSKLIPPQEVLIDKLQSDVINNLEDVITEEILKDAGLAKLVDEAYKQLEKDIINSKITIYVEQELKKTPINSWRKPVAQMAKEIIKHRR